MWRRILVLMILVCAETAAQNVSETESMMKILGVGTPEELDLQEVERLSELLARPLKINVASQSSLIASGLLSSYQIASLTDYIDRHGPIMSLTELSYVDGFGRTFVERLSPFISLGPFPQYDTACQRFHGEISTRSGLKINDEYLWTGGVRTKFEYGEMWTLNMALSSPYGHFEPDKLAYSVSACHKFRKCPGKVIVGDFNARFGQGLLLWNGLSIRTLLSPSSFIKNPTGISQSSSWTGNYAMTGAAAEISIKQFTVSAFLAMPGVKKMFRPSGHLALAPSLNLTWNCMHGQVAMTHYAEFPDVSQIHDNKASLRSSIDTRWCVRGTDLFAEVYYDWATSTPAALAGVIVPVKDKVKLAGMLRYYPVEYANEYALSFCSEFDLSKKYEYPHRAVLTLDTAHYPEPKRGDRGLSTQIKLLLLWEWKASHWLTVKLRTVERYRTWGDPLHSDLRAEAIAEVASFRAAVRINALECVNWGLLSYAEAGYKRDRLSLYIRYGMFRIDDWEDRIYVYERDAPGNFNVPAYYGRGLWAAMTFSLKCARWCRLYCRAAYTCYPFMHQEKRKPGKAELKLQSVFSF